MEKARKRFRVVALISAITFIIIFGRVIQLTFRGSRQIKKTRIEIVRGPILDRRSITLAITEEASIITVAPREIIDLEFTAQSVSRILSIPLSDVIYKFNENMHRKYFIFKRQVENHLADQIMELHLPGIHREREFQRVYPADKLASNLLGFVGRDQKRALAGLERIYHKILIDPVSKNEQSGPSLYLTLDSLIQYRMEKELGQGFIDSGSKRAVGIMMNIHTGEIIALANFPNYNPNEYYRTKPFQRANWAIRFNYEPGSTVKIFMSAILLSEKVVNLHEKFHCGGTITFGDIDINCKYKNKIHSHGWLTFPEILQKSCNVGIIKAMQRIKKERFYHYMHGLGFGEKTEILPGGSGETSGYFPPLNRWVPSTGYYMPIGQSFSVTPLQLLKAASSIANGGRLLRPYIAEKITSSNGRIISRNNPFSKRNPFAPRVNNTVLRMMRKVVTDGTGRGAALKEITSAGKTGTGQKATASGYVERYVASFVGFFPAVKPQYGILILFDEPRGHASGGSLAAPVFRRIVRSILPIIEQGVKSINPGNLKRKTRVPRINQELLHDFTGLSAREAIDIIVGQYHLSVRLIGSGYVYKQNPPPGTRIQGEDKIILYLDSH